MKTSHNNSHIRPFSFFPSFPARSVIFTGARSRFVQTRTQRNGNEFLLFVRMRPPWSYIIVSAWQGQRCAKGHLPARVPLTSEWLSFLSPCVRGIRPCVPYTWRSLTTHLGVWKGAEQDECDQTVNKIVKYRCNVHCTGSFKAGWIWIGSGGNDWLLHLPFPQIIDFADRRRDLLHCRQVIKVTNETSAWFPFSIGKLA